jgi:hypothetical protein
MGGGPGVVWFRHEYLRSASPKPEHPPEAAAVALRPFCMPAAGGTGRRSKRLSYHKGKEFPTALAAREPAAAPATSDGTLKLAMQRSGRLTDDTLGLLRSVGLSVES